MAHALTSAPLRAAQMNAAESAPPAGLSPLEWRVVAMGRADGSGTFAPARARDWLSHMFFGPPPAAHALANARLEALRRLAASAQDRYSRAAADATAAARAAGYNEFQIAAVVAASRAGARA